MQRLLLDTHAFLWWLADTPELGDSARKAIADERNEVFVSAATGWEVAIKRARQAASPRQPRCHGRGERLFSSARCVFSRRTSRRIADASSGSLRPHVDRAGPGGRLGHRNQGSLHTAIRCANISCLTAPVVCSGYPNGCCVRTRETG